MGNPPKPQPKPRNVKIMRAIYDYTAEEEDELSFLVGDILYILDQSEDDWWKARCKGKEGLIPSNLVEAASGDGGTSPLHDAAKRGNIELLRECLVKAGANTKMKNNEKKGLEELAKDPDVGVVLRKWGVIAVVDRKSIAFGDDDYNDNEDEED